MKGNLEKIAGEKLESLMAEIMARKGYSIKQDPASYPDIEVLAVTNQTKKTPKLFINTSGRSTTKSMGEIAMQNSLPDPLDLSDDAKLLIVTTCRSTSREARQIASSDPTPKNMWYVNNLLDEIRDVNSEYLIEMYNSNKYHYKTEEGLRDRFRYQNIRVPDRVVNYIVEDTYHPRKIVAYIEFNEKGLDTDLDDIPAVSKFKTEFTNL